MRLAFLGLFAVLFCSNASGQHDRWGTEPRDTVREFVAFTVSFDGEDDDDGDGEADLWRIPQWVAYELEEGDSTSDLTSTPGWTTDPDLFDAGIAPRTQSYTNTGYSRGHMCMREHATRRGTLAEEETYTLLNACPQLQDHNNGVWKGMENKTADWADLYGRVWIICGPIMHDEDGNRRPTFWTESEEGELEVSIPDKFFKIVVKESENLTRPDVLAFVYDHEEDLGSSSARFDHRPFQKTVREIEELTGLNFFTVLPNEDQEAIETVKPDALWPTDLDWDRGGPDRLAFMFQPSAAIDDAGEPLPPTNGQERPVAKATVQSAEVRGPFLGITDSLGLLAIIIALAAYVAVVRHRIIDAKRERRGDMKRLRRSSALLVFADYPLVAAGLLLATDIVWRLFSRGDSNAPGVEPEPTVLFWIAGCLFLFTITWMGILHAYESLGGLKDLWHWLRRVPGTGGGSLLPIQIEVEPVDQAGIVVYCGQASRYYEFRNIGAAQATIRLWKESGSPHEDLALSPNARIPVDGIKIMIFAATTTPTTVLCLGPAER